MQIFTPDMGTQIINLHHALVCCFGSAEQQVVLYTGKGISLQVAAWKELTANIDDIATAVSDADTDYACKLSQKHQATVKMFKGKTQVRNVALAIVKVLMTSVRFEGSLLSQCTIASLGAIFIPTYISPCSTLRTVSHSNTNSSSVKTGNLAKNVICRDPLHFCLDVAEM